MSGKGQTPQKTTAKTPATKPKAPPKAPAYTMVIDETGAMKRVPVTAVAQPKPSVSTVTPKPPVRPAITTAAVQQTARKPIVINEEEEELVYNAPQPVKKQDNSNSEENYNSEEDYNSEENNNSENELVYDATGEVTGEARLKALAEIRAKQEAETQQKVEEERKPRKPNKAEENLQNAASDIEKMRLFYRYRAKNPIYFQYTAEGNLEVKENNPLKVPAMIIPMRAFGPLKLEELEEVEQTQRDLQAEIEHNYVVKLKELRLVNEAYDPNDPESIAAVVKVNEQLREISVARNAALYPERWTQEIESVDTRRILLDQPYEERKLGYPIYLFKRYPFSRKDVEGHYREHGEAPQLQEGGGTIVLFITDPEDQKTGIFHPAYEHEFVFNETKYASPYQAFHTEHFKQLEDEGMVKKLLGTRSARTIKNLVEKEISQPQFPQKLWEEILEAYCSQYKEAGDKLKETGSARFHMMDKVIGTPEYAVALANVRTKLKEKENDAPDNVDAIKNSTITKEQQQKDKVGAIVNTFRKRNF